MAEHERFKSDVIRPLDNPIWPERVKNILRGVATLYARLALQADQGAG